MLPRAGALLLVPGPLLAAIGACSVADLTAGSSSVAVRDGSSSVVDGAAEATDDARTASAAAPGDAEAGVGDAGARADLRWDASSWDAPAGPVMVQNALNHEYLDVAGASLSDRAQIVTSSLTGRSDQLWTFEALGDTSYEIVNMASSKCLDDPNGLAAAGTSLIQFACSGNTNQRWYVVDEGGNLTIVGQSSGKCLASQSLSSPDVVIIGDCSTISLAQQWHIPR